jgi:hypothetical protein
MTRIAGSGSISQRHGSVDPDSYQNVTDLSATLIMGLASCGSGHSLAFFSSFSYRSKGLDAWQKLLTGSTSWNHQNCTVAVVQGPDE